MKALLLNFLVAYAARRRPKVKDSSNTEESGLEQLVSKEISQVNPLIFCTKKYFESSMDGRGNTNA